MHSFNNKTVMNDHGRLLAAGFSKKRHPKLLWYQNSLRLLSIYIITLVLGSLRTPTSPRAPVMSWAPSNSTHTIVVVYALVTLLLPTNVSSVAAASSTGNAQHLAVEFYSKTCPQLEQLVSAVTSKQVKDAPVSAPATIRLFFSDCFVDVNFTTSIEIPPMFFHCYQLVYDESRCHLGRTG